MLEMSCSSNSLPSRQELLFRGNFIVPLHNPFADGSRSTSDNDVDTVNNNNDVSLLGPSLEIRIDHVMHVDINRTITHFEHNKTDTSQRLLSRQVISLNMVQEDNNTSCCNYTQLSKHDFFIAWLY